MPTLPAITTGATPPEKAKAYEDWLINALIDMVERVEARVIDEQANTDKATRLDALRASLPPRRGAQG